jgi:Uma2 family endonuclease
LRKEEQYSAEKRYTYADFVTWWNDEDRYEIIDGVAYIICTPSRPHQKISGNLHGLLWTFLRGKPCEVYHPPFAVCLNAAGDKDDTVVQPDLIVVCDMPKLERYRCNGAPDMAVEILSPSSKSRDLLLKFNKYMQTGVREYWIVDPDAQTVQVCILKDGQYDVEEYSNTDTVPVHVLDGCKINMQEVFAE